MTLVWDDFQLEDLGMMGQFYLRAKRELHVDQSLDVRNPDL